MAETPQTTSFEPPRTLAAPSVGRAAVTVVQTRTPRAGELTPRWRIGTALTWIGVIVAFASVWNASRQLGLATWWLGPRGQSQPQAVQLLPFLAPAAMVVATIAQVRRLPWFGLSAAAGLAVIGALDLDRVTRIGWLEMAIAAAAAAISLTSFAGVYRNTTPD